eukprot:1157390-Pelagomonas_calceolata.AAC.6
MQDCSAACSSSPATVVSQWHGMQSLPATTALQNDCAATCRIAVWHAAAHLPQSFPSAAILFILVCSLCGVVGVDRGGGEGEARWVPHLQRVVKGAAHDALRSKEEPNMVSGACWTQAEGSAGRASLRA